jgi:hypothetical protein
MKLMGFVDSSKSIRYYNPNMKMVKVSRNFKFTDHSASTTPQQMITIDGLRAEGELERDDSQTKLQMTPKADLESETEIEGLLTITVPPLNQQNMELAPASRSK